MGVERLYYHDSYLADFTAQVTEQSEDGRRSYLDRTAFYPASGGQPHDLGWIAGTPVIEVIDEGERIAHVTAAPVGNGPLQCRLDWARRFDHMQQHTGQHLLSAVLVELFGIPTLSFHMGAEASTIDVDTPSLAVEQAAAAEARANSVVFENRPVSVSFQHSSEQPDLRKPSEREGLLRIVAIEGLDRSACGGTHVRATGEIGPILLRKLDKAHGAARIEFLCGMRAVRRAHADYEALSKIGRLLTSPLEETPALVAAQAEALQAAEKTRRRLATELARAQGRELYEATAPDAAGLHRVVRRLPKGALDDDLRATAQGFTAQAKAIFVAAIDEPASLLLAVSKDTGLHAGVLLKAAFATAGGRGGGSALQAQGGLPGRAALDTALAALLAAL